MGKTFEEAPFSMHTLDCAEMFQRGRGSSHRAFCLVCEAFWGLVRVTFTSSVLKSWQVYQVWCFGKPAALCLPLPLFFNKQRSLKNNLTKSLLICTSLRAQLYLKLEAVYQHII